MPVAESMATGATQLPPATMLNNEPVGYWSLVAKLVVAPTLPPGWLAVSATASITVAVMVAVSLVSPVGSLVAVVVAVKVTAVAASFAPSAVPGAV